MARFDSSESPRGRKRVALLAMAAFAAVALSAIAIVFWAANPERFAHDDSQDGDRRDSSLGVVGDENKALSPIPRQVADRGFVSSSACRECHPRQHASWSKTFHRTMTQLASKETVKAPFDGVKLEARGRTVELSQRGDQFFATMDDPAHQTIQATSAGAPTSPLPQVTKPVVMTTGSHHMQGYWVATEKSNELVQIPFYYHFSEKRWIPREDVFLRSPERDPQLAQWSLACVKCHSVAGVPGGMPLESKLDTKVAELGIACEACHGPGEKHIQAARTAKANSEGRSKVDSQAASDFIVDPSALSHRTQSEICGQCHSEFMPADPVSFWGEGLSYRAGGDFAKSHKLVRYEGEAYRQFPDKYRQSFWSDGTCRVGGDEFNALVESPCYQRGEMSCLSCHSMHEADPNDLLKSGMETNQACTQCHREERFDAKIEEHTHHAAGSEGSLCYNCHMPYTTYALMSGLRSHRVTTPRIESISHRAQPNACNLCHLDRTLAWSAEKLAAWSDSPAAATASSLRDDERTVAASLLWLLRGDAMQRALAAWHMRWPPAVAASGDEWQMPFLAEALNDPYTAVRFQAVKSIQASPRMEMWQGDYLAGSAENEKSRDEALRMWLARERVSHDGDRSALLLDKQGEVDRSAVDDLLRRRDNSRVSIPE